MVTLPSHPQRLRLRAEIAPVNTIEIGIAGFCVSTRRVDVWLRVCSAPFGRCIVDSLPHLSVDIVDSHFAPGFKHGFKGRLDSLVGTFCIVLHFSKSLSYGSTEILDRFHKLLHLREARLHGCCHLIGISKFRLLTSTLCFVDKLFVFRVTFYKGVIVFSSLHTRLHQQYLRVGCKISKAEIREQVCTLTEKVTFFLYLTYAFLLCEVAFINRPLLISKFLRFIVLLLLGGNIFIVVLYQFDIESLEILRSKF